MPRHPEAHAVRQCLRQAPEVVVTGAVVIRALRHQHAFIRRNGCPCFLGFDRSNAFVRSQRRLRQLFEFLEAWQFVEVGQSESDQELLRCAVEDRPGRSPLCVR